jgi:parallel beta-helix repeat protein
MRLHFLKTLFSSDAKKSPARHRAVRPFKPLFEQLEDRRMLSGSTWWVGTAAGSNFADIQTAINSSSVHNGDTIKVEPGTYSDVGFPSDTVTVNKSLTIIGGQPRVSTQNGPSIVTSDDVGFTLKVNDITIQHFTIEPTTVSPATAGILTDSAHSGYKILDNIIENETAGVHLNTALNKSAHDSTISGNNFSPVDIDGILTDIGARNVTISNNFFSAASDAAIKVAGSSLSTDVDMLNNSVNGPSILLENATDSEISGNTMSGPTGSTDPNLTAAIFLGGGVTDTEVTQNAIIAVAGLTPSRTLNGIQVAPFPGTLLPVNDDNDIAWNTVVGANLLVDGILLDGATGSEVSHNSVQTCRADGIGLVAGSTDNSVTHNTSNLSFNGIKVNGSDGNSLSGNTTNNNTQDGISVNPSDNTIISGNTSNYNRVGIEIQGKNNTVTCNTTNFDNDEGILVEPSDKTTVSSNTASFVASFGIFVFNSTNSTISSNAANYNGFGGIEVEDDSNAAGQKDKISDNTTNGNRIGIIVTGSTRVTISKNTANSNQLNGIEVANGSGFPFAGTEGDTFDTISGNTANYNMGDGIVLQNVDTNTVTGNTASHNFGGNGIHLANSDKNTLTGNTTNFNLNDGILVDINSTANMIKKNTALNNGNWDIEDAAGLATTNTWSGNTFNSKSSTNLN